MAMRVLASNYSCKPLYTRFSKKEEGFLDQLLCDMVDHSGGKVEIEYNSKSERRVKEQGIIRIFDKI